MAASKQKPLFHDINFTLIRGPHFSGDEYDKVRQHLLDHGGVEVELEPSSQGVPTINLEDTTHIISPDIEFAEFSELERRRLAGEIDQRMLTVTKPSWVYDSIAKKRTQNVRAYNADPRMIFSGIDAVIADLPEGDSEAICGGILAMGGLYKTHLSKLTTHIVALTLDNEICKTALEKGLAAKIVMPHWFDDCLKLNRRIDETPYLLPNADIMTMKASDPLPYPSINLTHTHDHREKLEVDPKYMRRETVIFTGKNFFFSGELGLNEKLLKIITDIVIQGSGKIATDIKNANVLVCPWRHGDDYIYASRKGIDVGNLTWLYWMTTRLEWVSPRKFLLHYPRAKIPIPGMEEMIISVSNYNGDARMYLENLIEAAGATFTRALKPENTHLITARDHSDKVDAAREWNTNIVNHLWLEESYAKWEMQTLTNPKYTTFPKRTNLMEIVGQTRIDLEAISHVFFPMDEEEEDEEEADKDEDIEMADVDADADAKKKKAKGKGKAKAEEAEERAEEEEEEEVEKKPAKKAGRPKGSKSTFSEDPTETPRGNRRVSALLETPKTTILGSSPPLSTGSRRAKESATKKLHEIMPDVLKFEKEKKRKGGVTHGGRRSHTPDVDTSKGSKKRSLPEETEPEPMDEDEKPEKPKKQKKKSMEKIVISVYLLLTSHQAWIDRPSREESDKRALREIGIQCIENPDAHVTHVCAPRVVRTEKFVCALARAPIIVNSNWVDECLKQKAIVDTKPYLLKDADGEKKLKMNLKESLERAKENEGKLLEGLTVYITPNVSPGFETFKKIVEANSGSAVSFKAAKRGGIAANKDASTSKRLVLVTAAKDDKLWSGFKRVAKESGWDPLIYSTDWLLDAAMTQKLVWSDKFNLSK
ncbi:hypothetical protein TWF788_009260 [Orbilia oligospora]|uniref:BRCT domain-containing protein n=1 Tax=Orbilia oligospora TaxID=2813651 RepID=A0A7C8KLZ1_ORBOL|nr:hypothetical protein TWF788_009260 [Orbilia oligospora]